VTTLTFERCPISLEGVEDRTAIDLVEVAFSNLANLDGLQALPCLRTLRVHYCRRLSDISALEGLSKLADVTFYSTPRLSDYGALARIKSLESIELNGPYRVDSIRPFQNLPRLKHLALSRVKVNDGDYTPILENTAIQEVFWYGAPFKPPALSEIKRQRPDLLIGGNSAFDAKRATKLSAA